MAAKDALTRLRTHQGTRTAQAASDRRMSSQDGDFDVEDSLADLIAERAGRMGPPLDYAADEQLPPPTSPMFDIVSIIIICAIVIPALVALLIGFSFGGGFG